jgi:3-hydroxybutyryl-CoA dehydrogenase
MSLFEKTAVLGFGTMGAGIAQVVAASGRSVIVLENDQERLDVGLAAVDRFLSDGIRRGKATEAEKDEVLSRITGTTDIKDLAYADLVIEVVTEQREIKSGLLARVAEVVSPETVIVTNTSALPVSELARAVPNPGRFAGLHFFNPAPLMKIVEIVRGLETREDVLEHLEDFVKQIGKDPVLVKDRPGFLVNWLLMPYLNDVVQEYDDGLASAEDIDTAIRLGLGYKLGPLELMDLIGLDVHTHATQSAYEATLDPAFAPPPLLRTMVAAGMHGNKSGRGLRSEGAK